MKNAGKADWPGTSQLEESRKLPGFSFLLRPQWGAGEARMQDQL